MRPLHQQQRERYEDDASHHSLDDFVGYHSGRGYDMQLTMPSEPARAVSTAIKILSNFAQLKFCAILVKGYGLKVMG